MKKFYLVIISALLLTGCTTDTWTGFYYPDINNRSKFITEGPLNTPEECRDWVNSQAKHNTGRYEYACGKNCKVDALLEGIPDCDETVQ